MAGAIDASVQLKKFYDQNHSIIADFKQNSYDTQGKLMQNSSGKMAIKRPGLFRWDYAEPFEQQIIADGKDIWVYDKDLDQVSVRGQKEALGATPSSVLMEGYKVVEEQFNLEDHGEINGYNIVMLKPKKEECEYKLIVIAFFEQKLTIMEIEDRFGQKTTFRFVNIKGNPELPEDYFTFVVPEGVDVIGPKVQGKEEKRQKKPEKK